jgi:hypothetical protein
MSFYVIIWVTVIKGLTNMIIKKQLVAIVVAITLVVLSFSAAVSAANTPTLNQTINAGTISTDILDSGRTPVGSPSAAMGAKTFSFDCQYGGNASTGTLGSTSERVYVINPNAAINGWTLTIAATSGVNARWQNGGATRYIDFNDPSGANPGCNDGADATDTTAGQLTIDPSVSTITTDCLTCVATNITKGSSTGYNQGTTDSVTLLNAAAASDDIWRGYLTGVGLSQTIPAEQPADSYSINLTLTATAL